MRRDRNDGGDKGFRRRQLHYSPNLIGSINNGVENTRVLNLEYDSREKGVSVRDIEPMAIVYKERKRNLVGYCRLRDDYRCFRLDRISTVKVMNESFSPREDFNVSDYEDETSEGGYDNYNDNEESSDY